MSVRIARQKDIRNAVRTAVHEIGGIKLPRPGSRVLLKPNVNTSAPPPASTNPVVVSETVRLVFEAGAQEVIVGDRSWVQFFVPGQRNTVKNMKDNGIYEAARTEGARIVGFEEGRWVRIKPAGAVHWRGSLRIAKVVTEVDFIISLPVLKTHWITDFSLSLKNSVGILHTLDRLRLHASHIHAKIAELNLAYDVDLTIIDGSSAFIQGGPNEGKIVRPETIIVSDSRVEADVEGYRVLREVGANLPPEGTKHPMISRAIELGIDRSGEREQQKS